MAPQLHTLVKMGSILVAIPLELVVEMGPQLDGLWNGTSALCTGIKIYILSTLLAFTIVLHSIAQMCTYNHVFASDNVLVHCMTMYDNVQQCTEVHQPLVGLHTLEYLLLNYAIILT